MHKYADLFPSREGYVNRLALYFAVALVIAWGVVLLCAVIADRLAIALAWGIGGLTAATAMYLAKRAYKPHPSD